MPAGQNCEAPGLPLAERGSLPPRHGQRARGSWPRVEEALGASLALPGLRVHPCWG